MRDTTPSPHLTIDGQPVQYTALELRTEADLSYQTPRRGRLMWIPLLNVVEYTDVSGTIHRIRTYWPVEWGHGSKGRTIRVTPEQHAGPYRVGGIVYCSDWTALDKP